MKKFFSTGKPKIGRRAFQRGLPKLKINRGLAPVGKLKIKL